MDKITKRIFYVVLMIVACGFVVAETTITDEGIESPVFTGELNASGGTIWDTLILRSFPGYGAELFFIYDNNINYNATILREFGSLKILSPEDIRLDAGEGIWMDSIDDIDLDAGDDVDLTAGHSIDLDAVGDIDVDSEGDINIAAGGTGDYIYLDVGANGCEINDDYDFSCAGNKNAKIYLPDTNETFYLHATESPTVDLYERGSSQLTSGKINIELSEDFKKVITKSRDLMVFVTPKGPCNLYISDSNWKSFEVKSIDLASNCEFNWIAYSYRDGYEEVDMTVAGKTYTEEEKLAISSNRILEKNKDNEEDNE